MVFRHNVFFCLTDYFIDGLYWDNDFQKLILSFYRFCCCCCCFIVVVAADFVILLLLFHFLIIFLLNLCGFVMYYFFKLLGISIIYVVCGVWRPFYVVFNVCNFSIMFFIAFSWILFSELLTVSLLKFPCSRENWLMKTTQKSSWNFGMKELWALKNHVLVNMLLCSSNSTEVH